ncbi:MAG: hypothetical protein ACTSUR_02875 [Candidatus Heimdallarchaeaceae archaeon]
MEKGVKIDEIDIKMFEIIKREKECTTTQIAKELFSPKDDYELRKKDVFIRKRLNKWVEVGLIEKVENNGKSFYKIPLENIIFGKASIVVENEEKRVDIDIGNAMVVKLNDKWIIVQYE